MQFTRNNMTASMFDLTVKDKPRSVFGKLKDRVTGRKRGDVESSSAILPGRYAALSGSLGQPLGEMGGGTLEQPDAEITEEKKSKMKEFLKGKLRKSSDTRSCTSLASEGSTFSVASDHPPPSLDLLSDPPSSPIYTTKVRVDAHGESDLAKKGEVRNECCLLFMLPANEAHFLLLFNSAHQPAHHKSSHAQTGLQRRGNQNQNTFLPNKSNHGVSQRPHHDPVQVFRVHKREPCV